ncbi:hypothetical protein AJ79_09564 [Helicocarpus griseus UAMH5409]|uniref:Chalcone synthase n=1 Tax=Helicocarpus griseus UAMH5409 TaxID=1447875 RepID=A0A2B7WIN8_9EURO|nr:hypothetical protein AJ79_09564 [Helicocarpus griseus UAMH5409]
MAYQLLTRLGLHKYIWSSNLLSQTESSNLTEPHLEILSIGVVYPVGEIHPEDFVAFAKRHYGDSSAIRTTLKLNDASGILVRSSVFPLHEEEMNASEAPSIGRISRLFKEHGVKLAVEACKKAINEWGGSIEDITHLVAVTCTDSSNPGYHEIVARELKLKSDVDKVLLHGVGCSGGLAALRTAANVLQGAAYRSKKGRALVIATEINTSMARCALDQCKEEHRPNIAAVLFSDCASVLVLSNGVQRQEFEQPIYRILNWKQKTIPNTESEIQFNVHANGWKNVLTKDIPYIAANSVGPLFGELVRETPLDLGGQLPHPTNFDWALHPGGLAIIDGTKQALGLSSVHLAASYEVYRNYGNSSSATVISVMDRLRRIPGGKDYVVACAFGPGVSVEMALMVRSR